MVSDKMATDDGYKKGASFWIRKKKKTAARTVRLE